MELSKVTLYSRRATRPDISAAAKKVAVYRPRLMVIR